MTEERILELLTKKYSNISLTCHSKYEDETIKNISKTISELIYKNINSELASNVEKRMNLIMFIRLFLDVNSNHLHLEDYSLAIDTIKDNVKDDEIQDLIVATENEHIVSYDQALNSKICNLYDLVDEKRRNRATFKSYIADRDEEKLQYFSAYKSLQFEQESTATFLTNLLNINDGKVGKLEEDLNDDIQTKKKLRKNYRMFQVECIYGLLNVMQTEDDRIVLERLLKRLSFYKELIKPELNLLTYILLCPNDEARYLVLKYFKFMIEKVVIKLCTCILQSDQDVSQVIRDTKNMTDIFNVAQQDADFKSNVMEILFELFKMSNFNKKLLVLYKRF